MLAKLHARLSAISDVQGPQIVSIPQFDTPKRYWIVPFADAYLNEYSYLGSDFNTTAGDYLVVGRSAPLCSLRKRCCAAVRCSTAAHKPASTSAAHSSPVVLQCAPSGELCLT